MVLPRIGTAHHAPIRAVPMLDQRVFRGSDPSLILAVANGPDVGRAQRRDLREEISLLKDIGTLHDAPLGAVPVFDERFGPGFMMVICIAHRPDIGGRERSHTHEIVVACPWVGAIDDAPLRAVPMFNQRQSRASAAKGAADGPRISAGKSNDRTQIVSPRLRIGRWDESPL